MTRPLILSEGLLNRSDESQGSFHLRLTQTSPRTCAGHASDRASDARDADRDLQALRPSNCRCVDGPGHGPKHYLSVSQPGGRPHRNYVRNADFGRVAQFINNLHDLRDALDEICAINTELVRRHEDLG